MKALAILLSIAAVVTLAGAAVTTFVAIWTVDHTLQGRWIGTAFSLWVLGLLAVTVAALAWSETDG